LSPAWAENLPEPHASFLLVTPWPLKDAVRALLLFYLRPKSLRRRHDAF
jgi:hypothetical protein